MAARGTTLAALAAAQADADIALAQARTAAAVATAHAKITARESAQAASKLRSVSTILCGHDCRNLWAGHRGRHVSAGHQAWTATTTASLAAATATASAKVPEVGSRGRGTVGLVSRDWRNKSKGCNGFTWDSLL